MELAPPDAGDDFTASNNEIEFTDNKKKTNLNLVKEFTFN